MAVWLSKIYTKSGDGGDTSLVGGQRVRKNSLRIESYGTVDELNAVVGLCRRANQTEAATDTVRDEIDGFLHTIQNQLFNLGSLLATLPADLAPAQPRIEEAHITALELAIDGWNESLEPLRSFTLPGGGWVSSYLHLARTVCRRAERTTIALAATEPVADEAVRYLNRLSDAFYVLGRWNTQKRGETEPLWTP